MPSRPGVQTSVLVNGVADPTLRPLSAHRSLGGKSLDTATFAVDLAAAGQRVQNLALTQGGEEVEIVALIDGVLTSLAWGSASIGSVDVGHSEGLSFTIRMEPYHLGLILSGAYYNLPEFGPVVIQLDPVFNPLIDGACLPNRSADYFLGNASTFLDPESVRTMEAETLQGGAAEYWTLPEAINYLCWSLNPDELYVLNPAAADLALLPEVALQNVGLLRGQFLGDYLDQLLSPFGWTWCVALEAPGLRQLVLFQRGVGEAKSVLLQAPGSSWAGDNAEQTSVDYNVGSTRNNVTVAGDWHYFESTFELFRAWVPDSDACLYTTLSQDSGPYTTPNSLIRRVWRDWVLNEAGDYTGTRPEIDAAFDFEAILGHALVPRRQCFLPTLTLDPIDKTPIGQHFGVRIDFSIDDGATWLSIARMTDPTVQLLQRECGVRFDGLQVPSDLFEAGSDAKVRVTATLRDDWRLGLNLPNDATSPLAASNPIYVDTSERHHWREVLDSSIFVGLFGAALEADVADDAEELALFAETLKSAWDAADVSGSIELEGLDNAQYYLGDVITEIEGRAVSFQAAASGRWPQVSAIDYDFQSQKRTLYLETFSPPESLLSGAAAHGWRS